MLGLLLGVKELGLRGDNSINPRNYVAILPTQGKYGTVEP
jgi:hypothetical protein